ncbi:MAG: hypothetical protein ABFD62_03585 [Syntrophaceae bacterium]
MIEIKAIMNSGIEEIMNFKTACCLRLFDMNLEIHLRNNGSEEVRLFGYFDLEGDKGCRRVGALFPPGPYLMKPGDLKALYCQMDDNVWAAHGSLTFYDIEGKRYSSLINEQRPKPPQKGTTDGHNQIY